MFIKSKKFLSLFIFVIFVLPITIQAAIAKASQEEFIAEKKNVLEEKFGKKITLDEFNKTLNEFAKVSKERMQGAEKWLGSEPDLKLYNIENDLAETKFWPFAQRVKVERGGLIAFWGDIHGDLDNLLKTLQYLYDSGFIDDNLHITNDKLYIIFLGDYVDRGRNSIGVMHTLMKLVIANKDCPDHVILLRGNHEDLNMNSQYGFRSEIGSRFRAEVECGEKIDMQDQPTKLFDKVGRVYNLLPVFISISFETGTTMETIAACHGGIELGYDPRPLIKADKTVSFQLLGKLDRKENLDKFGLSELQKNSLIQAIPSEKLENYSPANLKEIGFVWSDFYVDPNKGPRYDPNRGLAWSRELTLTLLKTWNIKKLFRGHQHNNSLGPIYKQLLEEQGLVRLWFGEDVFTLLTSNPGGKSEFASFVLVSVAPWIIEQVIFDYKNKKFISAHLLTL